MVSMRLELLSLLFGSTQPPPPSVPGLVAINARVSVALVCVRLVWLVCGRGGGQHRSSSLENRHSRCPPSHLSPSPSLLPTHPSHRDATAPTKTTTLRPCTARLLPPPPPPHRSGPCPGLGAAYPSCSSSSHNSPRRRPRQSNESHHPPGPSFPSYEYPSASPRPRRTAKPISCCRLYPRRLSHPGGPIRLLPTPPPCPDPFPKPRQRHPPPRPPRRGR